MSEYLGDGLYASFDGYQIKLMANSATMPTDVVYLDPHTLAAFQKFIARFVTRQSEKEENEESNHVLEQPTTTG